MRRREGQWARACGSARAGPPQLPQPLLHLCPSPFPLPVAVQRLLHIGCQGSDVRDVRWSGLGGLESSGIRLCSLALQLLWQQGKQPGAGGRRGRDEGRRVLPSHLTPAGSILVPARCLPSFLPNSGCPENQASYPRPFPVSQSPMLANSHPKTQPQTTATGSESELLSNKPACPSSVFTPTPGGG